METEREILAKIMEVAGPEAVAHASVPLTKMRGRARGEHLLRVVEQLEAGANPLPRLLEPIRGQR